MVARVNRPPPLPPVNPAQVSDAQLQRVLDAIVSPLQAIFTFLQPYAQPEMWKKVPLLPDWENFAADYALAEYKKDPFGIVRVRGEIVDNGGHVSGDTIAVLPLNYRPKKKQRFAVATDSGTGSLEVTPEGNIIYLSGTLVQFSLQFAFSVD